MRNFLVQHAKPVSVVAGFCFGSIGALWSYLFVGSLQEQITQLTRRMATEQSEIALLNGAASDYFLANNQSDLIFVLGLRADAKSDIARLIYAGNLYDRATPIRNVIGMLASARRLDYRRSYDAYETLNERARGDGEFESFKRLKEFERDIVGAAQQRIDQLQQNVARDLVALDELERRGRLQSMLGVLSSLLGSTILLAANLLVIRREKPRA